MGENKPNAIATISDWSRHQPSNKWKWVWLCLMGWEKLGLQNPSLSPEPGWAITWEAHSSEWTFSGYLAEAAKIETRNPSGVRTKTGLCGKAGMLSGESWTQKQRLVEREIGNERLLKQKRSILPWNFFWEQCLARRRYLVSRHWIR